MGPFASRATCIAAALVASIGVCPLALAQQAPDFSGKTVTVIACFEAGGPYDFYARLIARHIGVHLPGKPNVIVQNMPGAGGLRGANYIYNVAPRDGTAMGVMSQTVAVGQVLATTRGIQYDARKYSWIGRLNANVEVDHAWYTSGVKSIADVMKREVIAAGTGPTSSSVVFRRLMNILVGTKYKVVTGFRGPTSAQLALERGEVHAIVKPWSSIKSGSAKLLRDKKIYLLVQFTRERHRELQDIPAVVDLAKNRQDREILALFAGGSPLGTSLVAPPGIPQNVVTAMRRAFDAAVRDPAFLADVKKSRVDIDPLPGEELQRVVAGTFDVNPTVLARAQELSRQISGAPRR
jgi:tripartite-type tricarboxylate transporter receptor subunit TctC